MSENIPSSLRVKILTARKLLAEEVVQEIILPGLNGCLGILPGHRPLMTALGTGAIRFSSDGSEQKYQVSGGYAEILPDSVLIFTELDQKKSDGTN